MLFLRVDLSQAEDRIVKILSHNQELIELARTKPWEFDVHSFNARLLFEKEEGEKVEKRERQAGKRIVHLSNYDGQPQRASDALLEEGFIVSPDECAARSALYHRRFPGIRHGYQLRTRMLGIKERRLVSSWGFSIEFPSERLDAATFRRWYAWRPQTEIGWLMNQWGILEAHERIKEHNLSARLRFQVHDEGCWSVSNVRDGWELARILRDSLGRQRSYEGEWLEMPADFALERRYHGKGEDSIEWKQFPSREDFEDAWRKLQLS